MNILVVKCPKCGTYFNPGIMMDESSFALSDLRNVKSQCPNKKCGHSFVWGKKDVTFKSAAFLN